MLDAIWEDCKYDAETARTVAEKLIYSDKCKYIGGPWNLDQVISVAPVSEAEEVIYIQTTSEMQSVRPEWKLIFMNNSAQQSIVQQLFIVADKYPEIKKAKGVWRSDLVGQTYMDFYQTLEDEAMARYGIEFMDEVRYEFPTYDWYPYFPAIRDGDPDLIVSSQTPAELAGFMKQSREVGLDYFVLGYTSLIPLEQWFPLCGGSENSQKLFAIEWDPRPIPGYITDEAREEVDRIYELYEAKVGIEMTYHGTWSHSCNIIRLLKEAWLKADSIDVWEVAHVLETETFNTFQGTYSAGGQVTLGANRFFEVPAPCGEIIGEEMITIGVGYGEVP
jgi:ABC-type branched-subunit amino acid transport system substrate-binding protein